MNLELPDGTGYAGVVLDGLRRHGSAVQRVWSVVVKRRYAIADGAATPVAAVDVVVADDVDPTSGEVRYEAEIAAFKPAADLLVIDWLPDPPEGGRIRVDGTDRLVRDDAAVASDDGDAARHLFGFEPRGGAARAGEAGDWSGTESLPAGYDDGFARVQRRGPGFTGTGLAALPATARIEVVRGLAADAEAYAFDLALPQLAARHWTWAGVGPDRESRWCAEAIGPLTADTLVVRPADDACDVLWRAVWDRAAIPAGRYRRVDVEEVA
jgi:hypothetical protein